MSAVISEPLAAPAADARGAPSTGRSADPLFGAILLPEGGVCFRLWAPDMQHAELLVSSDGDQTVHAARTAPGGWHECTLADAGIGTRYQWRLDGELVVPDPASRFNPGGPHAPSVVTDPHGFVWDAAWKGRPWNEAVVYELHLGTFTPQGTYAQAETKLAYLADLGITAIELMPMSTFSGEFGWGYDGVLPYAPYAGYGTPDELKHFVQAAHRQGLMVFLDVVYNHFGPDGSYLSAYASAFYSKVHKNPWGDSLNFDGDDNALVREFFIRNALYWLDEFRFDGLRFDAVHAIKDDSPVDVMDEMAQRIRTRFPDRHIHLVLENENNQAERLLPDGRFDAQWNDDFHHCMHVALTGEQEGYYADYLDRPVALVARSLAHGFLWEGSERSPEGRRLQRVESAPQPLQAMVNYLSNHDQTGNRAFGERIGHLVPAHAKPAAIALVLLSPSTPMIFAGEEFGSVTPFLYFADYCGELGEAITQGRLKEFGHFAKRPGGGQEPLPPPCLPETFDRSKLDWAFADGPSGLAMRGLVSRLLAARRAHLVPIGATLIPGGHAFHMTGERSFIVRWRYQGGRTVELACNLGDAAAAVGSPDSLPWGRLSDTQDIYQVGTHGPRWWSPWSARWVIGQEAAA